MVNVSGEGMGLQFHKKPVLPFPSLVPFELECFAISITCWLSTAVQVIVTSQQAALQKLKLEQLEAQRLDREKKLLLDEAVSIRFAYG